MIKKRNIRLVDVLGGISGGVLGFGLGTIPGELIENYQNNSHLIENGLDYFANVVEIFSFRFSDSEEIKNNLHLITGTLIGYESARRSYNLLDSIGRKKVEEISEEKLKTKIMD